jgi:hypothetical protein
MQTQKCTILSDRPVSDKRGYFARFFGFACAFGLRGAGGVANILRRTSSSLGAGCSRLGFSVFTA